MHIYRVLQKPLDTLCLKTEIFAYVGNSQLYQTVFASVLEEIRIYMCQIRRKTLGTL